MTCQWCKGRIGWWQRVKWGVLNEALYVVHRACAAQVPDFQEDRA